MRDHVNRVVSREVIKRVLGAISVPERGDSYYFLPVKGELKRNKVVADPSLFHTETHVRKENTL